MFSFVSITFMIILHLNKFLITVLISFQVILISHHTCGVLSYLSGDLPGSYYEE